jgi:ABC-type uncharacterized transport system substrate-binding protein
LSGKWLELVHEVAPHVSRVAFLFNPNTAPFARYYLDSFRSAALTLLVEPIETAVHSTAEVEAVMAKLGREAGAGLGVMSDTFLVFNRELIYSLAKRNRLPTIYPYRFFVTEGGLMYYGVDFAILFRDAATYVDRILRGAKPSELPVQLPTKFKLVIDLKTAKALGLTIPDKLLATADEVIE